MAPISLASRSARSSARSRRARMPPCTFGCSVFTRPPSISGLHVNSATSTTARPASRSARAVPPEATNSTPRATRPLPNWIRSRLSETESNARVTGRGVSVGGIGTSWGALAGGTRGSRGREFAGVLQGRRVEVKPLETECTCGLRTVWASCGRSSAGAAWA